MKIYDTLGKGGSISEIVHPILRRLGVYHGRRGWGISVEAKVKAGAVFRSDVTSKKMALYIKTVPLVR